MKLVGCVVRKPGMSADDFDRYWHENHATLATRYRKESRIQRYVQSPVVAGRPTERLAATRGANHPYDGVAEAWVDPDEFSRPRSDVENAALAEILADEDRFVDMSQSRVFFTEEHAIVDGAPPPDAKKIIFCLARKPDVDEDEFYRYWLEDHAPLVAGLAETLGIARYVQAHTIQGAATDGLVRARRCREPYAGLAQVWVDPARVSGPPDEARIAADQTLLADEGTFIDFANSSMFLTTERPIFR